MAISYVSPNPALLLSATVHCLAGRPEGAGCYSLVTPYSSLRPLSYVLILLGPEISLLVYIRWIDRLCIVYSHRLAKEIFHAGMVFMAMQRNFIYIWSKRLPNSSLNDFWDFLAPIAGSRSSDGRDLRSTFNIAGCSFGVGGYLVSYETKRGFLSHVHLHFSLLRSVYRLDLFS